MSLNQPPVSSARVTPLNHSTLRPASDVKPQRRTLCLRKTRT
nr:MAG TPA: hypothetical protein [Caudoviricetes sp.]